MLNDRIIIPARCLKWSHSLVGIALLAMIGVAIWIAFRTPSHRESSTKSSQTPPRLSVGPPGTAIANEPHSSEVEDEQHARASPLSESSLQTLIDRTGDAIIDRMEKSEIARSKVVHQFSANGETIYHIRIIPPSVAEISEIARELGFISEQLAPEGEQEAVAAEMRKRLRSYTEQQGDRILFVTENEASMGLAFGVYELAHPDDFKVNPDGTYAIHAKGMIDGSFGADAVIPRRWRHLVQLRTETVSDQSNE
jgi:hypothetical protein